MDVIVWVDHGAVPTKPPPSPEELEQLFEDVDMAIDQGTNIEREECIKEFLDTIEFRGWDVTATRIRRACMWKVIVTNLRGKNMDIFDVHYVHEGFIRSYIRWVRSSNVQWNSKVDPGSES